MKHVLRVGIDLDGCGYPFTQVYRDWLIRQGRDPDELATPTSTWRFFEEWGMDEDEFMAEFAEGVRAGFLFTEGEPFPGFVEAVDAMVGAGHEVHVVTSRNIPGAEADARRQTFEWLARHSLPVHSVSISHDKGCVETDVFLEDNVENYETLDLVGETHAVLMTRSHNAGHPGRRVDSWEEFTTLVESLCHDFIEVQDGVGCPRCSGWWRHEEVELRLTGSCPGVAPGEADEDEEPVDFGDDWRE